MPPQVLITDIAWPTLDIERGILESAGAELIVAKTGEEGELISLAPPADAILTCWKNVSAAVIDAAPRCRIINRYGIGLDNIAVEHATKNGILVTNVPDYCLEEVSDHAMALLLACARKVGRFVRDTSRGVWNLDAGRPIPRLRGQTLGLVGFGKIPRALVPKALGFGMKVVTHDPALKPGPLAEGVTAVGSLDELLAAADYVSVHVPAMAATNSLINAAALARMKPTAFLINTARGAVIDEEALVAALREGRIAGAALDVLKQEPPDPKHPLFGMENVILTPHAAFYSETSTQELQRRSAEQVAAVLRGELPPNIVNPKVREAANFRFEQVGLKA